MERAGFVSIVVQGKPEWVDSGFLVAIANQVELWRDRVEAILAEPARPRGWQPGVSRKPREDPPP
jgi:hypothetical protein